MYIRRVSSLSGGTRARARVGGVSFLSRRVESGPLYLSLSLSLLSSAQVFSSPCVLYSREREGLLALSLTLDLAPTTTGCALLFIPNGRRRRRRSRRHYIAHYRGRERERERPLVHHLAATNRLIVGGSRRRAPASQPASDRNYIFLFLACAAIRCS